MSLNVYETKRIQLDANRFVTELCTEQFASVGIHSNDNLAASSCVLNRSTSHARTSVLKNIITLCRTYTYDYNMILIHESGKLRAPCSSPKCAPDRIHKVTFEKKLQGLNLFLSGTSSRQTAGVGKRQNRNMC